MLTGLVLGSDQGKEIRTTTNFLEPARSVRISAKIVMNISKGKFGYSIHSHVNRSCLGS